MKSQQLVEMKHFCPPQYDAVMVTQTKFKWLSFACFPQLENSGENLSESDVVACIKMLAAAYKNAAKYGVFLIFHPLRLHSKAL